jgi:hypothetical protein
MPVISATWEVELGGSQLGQPRQKGSETLSQKTCQAQWYASVLLAMREVPSKNGRPYLKNK